MLYSEQASRPLPEPPKLRAERSSHWLSPAPPWRSGENRKRVADLCAGERLQVRNGSASVGIDHGRLEPRRYGRDGSDQTSRRTILYSWVLVRKTDASFMVS